MKKKLVILALAVLVLAVLVFPSFAAADETPAPAASDAGNDVTGAVSNRLTLWDFFYNGTTLSLIGIFLAVTLSGIGSAKGVGIAGQTATGIVSVDPSLSTKCQILEMLPATQGLYGFVAGFLVMTKNGIFGGSAPSVADGMFYLWACLPIAVVGLVSAIHQGKVAASGMQMLAKQKDQFAKGIMYAAVVETYAILAVLISALLILLH